VDSEQTRCAGEREPEDWGVDVEKVPSFQWELPIGSKTLAKESRGEKREGKRGEVKKDSGKTEKTMVSQLYTYSHRKSDRVDFNERHLETPFTKAIERRRIGHKKRGLKNSRGT